MNKRNIRKIRSISFALLLILTVTLLTHKFITPEETYTRIFTYTVEAHDTLWDIASEYNFNNDDVRKIIHDIKNSNNIGTTIYPGQVIQIPITFKDNEIDNLEQYHVALAY